MSEGTQKILSADEHPSQLASILVAEASRWEGVIRDGAGHVEGRLIIALHAVQAQLRVVAARPAGFPAELPIGLPTGETVRLIADDVLGDEPAEYYDGLDIPLNWSVLDGGLRLSDGVHVLRLPPYSIHVLHMSPDLGCWASAEHIRPAETAWLLVRRQQLAAVEDYLTAWSRSGWSRVEDPRVAIRGWQVIRDVTIDAGPAVAPPGLARLVPRKGNRLLLSGGLPLAQPPGTYLSGGEPDVTPPPLDGVAAPVHVDGVKRELDRRATTIRIAALALAPGPHTVEMIGFRRHFATLRTTGIVTVTPPRRIGHLLRLKQGRLRPTALSASELGSSPRTGEIVIEGATVTGADSSDEFRAPILLNAGAREIVLLGAAAGQIEVLAPPRRPPWMERHGLNYRVFEHVPNFDVAWMIVETQWSGRRARLVHNLEPTAGTGVDASAARRWRRELLESQPPSDAIAADRWSRYVACAEETRA